MNTNKLLSTSFKWDNKETILNELSHKNKVRFALFCVKQVKHLIDDEDSKKVTMQTVNIIELFLEDKATAEECKKADDVANIVVYNAHASTGANTAAFAVLYNAIHAAAYTVHATSHATYAAYTVSHASYYTNANEPNKDQLKQEQMDYLRELVMGELSEEERDNWLLITLI